MANYLEKIISDPKNVWHYAQGTVRMWMFKNANYLLRRHILEQFLWRRKRALKCSDNGTCFACGCKTPDLFFADKPCGLINITDEYSRVILAQRKTICYPEMMTKSKWEVNKPK